MTTNDFGLGTQIPHSKLRPPRLRHIELTRSAVLDSASVNSADIVAICAPAGYGKSTLGIQWAARSPGPAAWVTCDTTDRDPLILMSSLGSALRQIVGDYQLSLADATLEEPGFSRRVLPAFAASMNAIETPVWVVVDDVHRIKGSQAAKVLATLVDALPIGSRVALIGRDLSPLPLSVWRGQGRLRDVGPEELSFSTLETQEALHRYRGEDPSTEVVERIQRSTDGWPVAVYLFSLLSDNAIPTRLSRIDEFIEDEVLGAMDAPVRRFVCETAVLEHLNAAAAHAVTGDEYAGRSLARAVRSTGLIRESGPDSWRCHPLLRECALAVIERDEPARVAVLHSRAADWYAEHGYIEEAVQQALASEDIATIDRVVWPAAALSLLRGRTQTTQRWFQRIGEHNVMHNADLSVMAAWASVAHGDYGEVLRHIEAALRILPPDWQHDLSAVPAAPHLALLLATVGAGVDDPAQATRLAQSALAHLDPEDPIRALTHTVKGLNLALLGEVDAEAELRRAAALAHATHVATSEVESLSFLGLLQIADGREALGLGAIEDAMHRYASHDLDQMTSTAAVLAPARLAWASLRGTAADVAAAISEITRVQPDIEPVLPWFRPLCGAVLAFADVRGGDYDRYAEHLSWCEGALAPSQGLCRRWARRAQQEFDRANPVASLSPAELRVWGLLQGRMTLTEIAAELFLSRETVKSHTVAIYRKLGIASRREAQELADTWG